MTRRHFGDALNRQDLTKDKVGVGPIKREDGSLATEDGEMAGMLNEFFTSVFSEEDVNTVPHMARETEHTLEA